MTLVQYCLISFQSQSKHAEFEAHGNTNNILKYLNQIIFYYQCHVFIWPKGNVFTCNAVNSLILLISLKKKQAFSHNLKINMAFLFAKGCLTTSSFSSRKKYII